MISTINEDGFGSVIYEEFQDTIIRAVAASNESIEEAGLIPKTRFTENPDGSVTVQVSPDVENSLRRQNNVCQC